MALATNPSNAREAIAMRNLIQLHLRPEELRAVNWRALTDAAAPAVARGWTGNEIGRWAIAELGDGANNPGAVMLTTIRALAEQDPPRERTPTPPTIPRGPRPAPLPPAQVAQHIAAIRQTIGGQTP